MLTPKKVDQLSAWCLYSQELEDVRSKARSEFFGYDEPGEAEYTPGTGDVTSRNRRLVGWFGFDFRLPGGVHPAELAAIAIFDGSERISALRSIRGCRYVVAVATGYVPGKSIYLKLEREVFRVDSPALLRSIDTSQLVCAHILPVGRERWLVCPGWVLLPILPVRNMRAHLKQFQPTPIEIERILQQRRPATEEGPPVARPSDTNLEDAVARMTASARAAGKDNLIKTPQEWAAMVLARMNSTTFGAFNKDVLKLAGKIDSAEEANRWLGLGSNIWNNTPQPDRGGKTANELIAERRQPPKPD